MKRWLLIGAVVVLAVAAAAAWFEPSGTVRGRLLGEPFFADRPASYWRAKLESEKPQDQDEAPKKLKEGGAAALPVLVALLHTDSTAARLQALVLLGKLGPDAGPAVKDVLPLLADADPYVRVQAANALGEVHPDDPAVVAALIDRLGTEDGPNVIRPLSRFKAAARDAVPKLIDIAEHGGDDDLRWNAIRTLGKIGPTAADAIPALMAALKDANPKVREHAAEALGDIGPASAPAVPVLAGLLTDANDGVRRDAARALGQIGPAAKDTIPALEKLLNDPELPIRQVAAQAIRRIDPSRPPLRP